MRIVNIRQMKFALQDIRPVGKVKQTVFLVHGWPFGHKMLQYQGEALISNGFHIVAMDLRGFGASDITADGYTYDQMARDIYNVIEEIKLKNFILAGFGVGAAICIRYMSLFKGANVSKLILMSAAAPSFVKREDYPFGKTREQMDEMIKMINRDKPYVINELLKEYFATQPSDSLINWLNCMGMDASLIGAISTVRALRDEDLREDLKYIRVPTGIFHGHLDTICPFSFATILNEEIFNTSLYGYRFSSHAIFYDEMGKFNQDLLSFLL